MSITQISKIQVRTGNYADLPVLSSGEFGYATDQERLFIGNPGSTLPSDNTEILTAGSFLLATRIQSSASDLITTGDGVVVYTNAGPVSVTLPTPLIGKIFYLKDGLGASRFGNPITITVANLATQTIDGGTSTQIAAGYNAIQLIAVSSTQWIIT